MIYLEIFKFKDGSTFKHARDFKHRYVPFPNDEPLEHYTLNFDSVEEMKKSHKDVNILDFHYDK